LDDNFCFKPKTNAKIIQLWFKACYLLKILLLLQSSSNENLNSPREQIYPSPSTLYKPAHVTHSDAHYLGMIQDVNLGGTGPLGREGNTDVQLIDKLEEAQVCLFS
jgi:hypothetical protein